jgi:hypothetical protein
VPGRATRFGRSAFATVLYGALIVAGWGFVSLLADSDVVSDDSIGPLVVPIAVALSAVGVFVALASPRWSTVASRGVAPLVGSAAVLGLGAAAIYLAALGVLQFVATGRPTASLLVVAVQAPTPYTLVVIGSGLLAGIALGLVQASNGRPSWPWEE